MLTDSEGVLGIQFHFLGGSALALLHCLAVWPLSRCVEQWCNVHTRGSDEPRLPCTHTGSRPSDMPGHCFQVEGGTTVEISNVCHRVMMLQVKLDGEAYTYSRQPENSSADTIDKCSSWILALRAHVSPRGAGLK